jgi:hypothetical protein
MIRNKMESKVVKQLENGEKQEIEIYVEKPNNDTVKKADRYKSKVWNQCIQDEILTKKELAVLMRKRGIWDDKKDQEEEQITKDIVELERQLYHGKNGKKPKVSEGRDIAVEIRRKRSSLRDLISEKIGLEENTADSLADNARFDFLVAHCTFYKDGRRVYKDYDEYNNKSADEIAFEAASLLGRMLYNLDNDFEKNLPENKFLTKFGLVNDDLSLIDPNNPEHLIDTKGKRIDEDGYYLDEDGSRVDRQGNRLEADGSYSIVEYENDLVEKPKPKRRTRKKTEEETVTES